MKSTCPTRTQASRTKREPYSTARDGARAGSARLRVGSPRLCVGFLDTSMLVSARIGDLEQCVGGPD